LSSLAGRWPDETCIGTLCAPSFAQRESEAAEQFRRSRFGHARRSRDQVDGTATAAVPYPFRFAPQSAPTIDLVRADRGPYLVACVRLSRGHLGEDSNGTTDVSARWSCRSMSQD